MMEPVREPELHPAEGGRVIRIGQDVLHVKALTGTDDGLVLLETVAAPGEPAPLDHVHHSYDEVFYIVEGQFQFRVGEHVAIAGPGSVVTAPRGAPHTFMNCGTSDGRVLIIGAPGRVAQMLEDIGRWAASPGPFSEDGLASVYQQHDTVLVPSVTVEAGKDENPTTR